MSTDDSSLRTKGCLTYTVEEAAALLGVSRAGAYNAVREGHLPVIRLGRRILIPKAAFDALLAGAPPVAVFLGKGSKADLSQIATALVKAGIPATTEVQVIQPEGR